MNQINLINQNLNLAVITVIIVQSRNQTLFYKIAAFLGSFLAAASLSLFSLMSFSDSSSYLTVSSVSLSFSRSFSSSSACWMFAIVSCTSKLTLIVCDISFVFSTHMPRRFCIASNFLRSSFVICPTWFLSTGSILLMN